VPPFSETENDNQANKLEPPKAPAVTVAPTEEVNDIVMKITDGPTTLGPQDASEKVLDTDRVDTPKEPENNINDARTEIFTHQPLANDAEKQIEPPPPPPPGPETKAPSPKIQEETPIPEPKDPEVPVNKLEPLKTQLSFLKLAEDGSVRLKIIGPMLEPEDNNERLLDLEHVCGPLQDGIDILPPDISEEVEQVHPVEFVEPPAFGSYLPINDSTFANITKEDSETLLEVYGGNPTCVEYAASIQNFANGAGNYVKNMVDKMMNDLTDNKHNEVVKVQNELNEIDALLEDLRNVQTKRLSASSAPIKPDEHEAKLADDVLKKITGIIKDKMKPGELCDSESILKALGIDVQNMKSQSNLVSQ